MRCFSPLLLTVLSLLLVPQLALADPQDPPVVVAVLQLGQETLEEGVREFSGRGLGPEAEILQVFMVVRRENLLRRYKDLDDRFSSLSNKEVRRKAKAVRKRMSVAIADLEEMIEEGGSLVEQLVEAEKRLVDARNAAPYRAAQTQDLIRFESSLGQRWLEVDSLLLELKLLSSRLDGEPAPRIEGENALRGAAIGTGAVLTLLIGLTGGIHGGIAAAIPHLFPIASAIAAIEALFAGAELRSGGVLARGKWRVLRVLSSVQQLRLRYRVRRCRKALEQREPLALPAAED